MHSIFTTEFNYSKIRDLEEELKIVGNALKSLEANESSVSERQNAEQATGGAF